MTESSTGIVLAGASALGAYEAGVLDYVTRVVAREVDRPRLFDIVSGTSAGAINAIAFATFADAPAAGTARLCKTWSELRLGHIIRPSATELILVALEAAGSPSRLARALRIRRARGGLLDPSTIYELLTRLIPTRRIADHLRAGLLTGVALSATHVATGRAVVFYEAATPVAPWRSVDEVPCPTSLTIAHAMASASIPLVFPPVLIDGELYCDGGLRQMVPLSPSLHLGARRLLVINPVAKQDITAAQARLEASSSPLYLAGKALNALFLDRTEVDVARVDQISAILRAGRRRYGASFDSELDAELRAMGENSVHEVHTLRIGPSRDLGKLASELVASPEFGKRERGLVGTVMRWLAQAGPARTGDLLSYLLFDGAFASELITLGRSDAHAHHAELCELLAPGRSVA